MSLKGIDISDNQGKIDWKKVKKAGVEFVIMRTTRKSGKADHYLDDNIKGCIENGIPFDFYKYGYATTMVQATMEARRVVEVLTEYLAVHGIKPAEDIVIWYDVEDDIQINLSTEQLTDIVRTFKEEVLKAGFGFGLYMGKYDFEKGEVSLPLLGETHVWLARYYDGYKQKTFGEEPNEKYKPAVTGGKLWGWQWTSSGRVDGIDGNVDINEAYYEITVKNIPVDKQGKYAHKVVEKIKSWLGKKESDGSHREIIDIYNAHKPLARGYAVKYTDAWCAATVSAVAIALGYTDIIPTECSCQKMIELFQKIGCWVEDENRIPAPAEIIFYDWQDSGKGDNTGWSDHVGIVESVSDGKITVIEGNYANEVKCRYLDVNGRYIRGYGVPKYDKEVIAENATTKDDAITENSNSSLEEDAITQIARDVIAGKYGNGHETRKEAIYEDVRERVNELLT